MQELIMNAATGGAGGGVASGLNNHSFKSKQLFALNNNNTQINITNIGVVGGMSNNNNNGGSR